MVTSPPATPAIDLALCTVGTSARELGEAAAAAEAAGFDAVWCYDHLSGAVLGGSRCVEVWSALTVIAMRTEVIGLGPLVLNAAVRHPAHIATAAAALDDVSNGRLLLGLGAGAGPESPFSGELAMLDLPVLDAATRRARVRDAVGYLRALWAGERSYHGVHHRFDDAEGVALPTHDIAIVIAANGPRMARVAGEVADALNVHDWQPSLEASVIEARRAADERGRSISVTVEGPFEPAWLDRSSEVHERLAALDASRVMLRWDATMGTDAIDAAATALAGR